MPTFMSCKCSIIQAVFDSASVGATPRGSLILETVMAMSQWKLSFPPSTALSQVGSIHTSFMLVVTVCDVCRE